VEDWRREKSREVSKSRLIISICRSDYEHKLKQRSDTFYYLNDIDSTKGYYVFLYAEKRDTMGSEVIIELGAKEFTT
jgi:hypothetical protein